MRYDNVEKYFHKLLFTFLISISIIALFTTLLFHIPENWVIFISELTPFMQKYIHHYDRVSFGFYSPFYDRLQLSNMLGISTLIGLFLINENFKNKLVILILPILIYTSILLGGRGGQVALFISILFLAIKYFITKIRTSNQKGKLILLSIFIVSILIASPFILYKY